MKVYDANLQVIAVANTDDDNEHLELNVIAGELYYLEVYSSEGINQYDLSIDVATRIGESFTLPSLTDQWQTVTFPKAFNNPVVVASQLTVNDIDPATIRIRNLTSTGFEIRIQEWDYQNGIHQAESASYLVMEAGRHVLPNGTVIEAGSTLVTNQVLHNVKFSTAFSGVPIVLTQVSSQSNGAAVVARLGGVKDYGFGLQMQEQESADGIHSSERIGWIAISHGIGENGATGFQSGLGFGSGLNIGFQQNFLTTPRLFVSAHTTNEYDPVSVRQRVLNRFGAYVLLQEEQSADVETTHASEQLGWLALDNGPLFVENGSTGGRFASITQSDDSDDPSGLNLNYSLAFARLGAGADEATESGQEKAREAAFTSNPLDDRPTKAEATFSPSKTNSESGDVESRRTRFMPPAMNGEIDKAFEGLVEWARVSNVAKAVQVTR
jgi:hypothetical protein